MTATDELRSLLDERGVEYRVSATGYSIDIGPNMTAYANRTDTTLDVSLRGFTPEQAIEATLGSDLEAENAKLRELVLHMHTCLEHYEPGDTISCKQCPYDNETWGCDYERLMAELGIEVDA